LDAEGFFDECGSAAFHRGTAAERRRERRLSMFRIMVMPDAERFLRVVANCEGSVFLHLPDEKVCDLKRDRTACQMLRLLSPGREGLEFSLSNPADLPAFIRYMKEAAA